MPSECLDGDNPYTYIKTEDSNREKTLEPVVTQGGQCRGGLYARPNPFDGNHSLLPLERGPGVRLFLFAYIRL